VSTAVAVPVFAERQVHDEHCSDPAYGCPAPPVNPEREDGNPLWYPQRWTRAMSGDEHFESLWDFWEAPIQKVWQTAFGYQLEDWQCWLLRHIFEVYPKGHRHHGLLKNTEELTLMGRQQGKTEVFSGFSLVNMLRKRDQTVVGLAYNVKQANQIFKRVKSAIDRNPSLTKRLKTSRTRGIVSKVDDSSYDLLAAKEESIQSVPINAAMVDEVHLLTLEIWTAVQAGMGARRDQILGGLSTAGDSKSELLLWLRSRGEAALMLDPTINRFGFYEWAALEAAVPKLDLENDPHDNALWAEIVRANPACASGRIDREEKLQATRAMPEADIIRYILNRDIASVNSFFPLAQMWHCAAPSSYTFPAGAPIYSIYHTPGFEFATIRRTVKTPDGKLHSKNVASLIRTSTAKLVDAAVRLNRREKAAMFAIAGPISGRTLGKELKLKRSERAREHGGAALQQNRGRRPGARRIPGAHAADPVDKATELLDGRVPHQFGR
jgi:hypothetical protein